MVPEFFNDRINDRFILKLAQPFWTAQDTSHAPPQVVGRISPDIEKQIDRMDRSVAIIRFCEVPRSLTEILEFFKLKDRKYLLKSVIKPLVEDGILERTIPGKPKSRFQKYVAIKSKY